MSYYDDGGEIEYGDDDDGHSCGRCLCALSDLELVECTRNDDGRPVCRECQIEEAQERSCADVGEDTGKPCLQYGPDIFELLTRR